MKAIRIGVNVLLIAHIVNYKENDSDGTIELEATNGDKYLLPAKYRFTIKNYLGIDHEIPVFEGKRIDVNPGKEVIESTSLPNCPFQYCDSNPHCEGKCRYDN